MKTAIAVCGAVTLFLGDLFYFAWVLSIIYDGGEKWGLGRRSEAVMEWMVAAFAVFAGATLNLLAVCLFLVLMKWVDE